MEKQFHMDMKLKAVLSIAVFAFVFLPISTQAQLRTDSQDQNIELGKVSWYRNYQEALALSGQTNKPVLILFQEVPGCMTCQRYGTNVLSHPLMVEVIENEFVPLVVFNNKGDADRKVLNHYNEPSWNNPVVRIVDQKGEDIVKRVSGNYTALGLMEAMATAKLKRKESIPGYMRVLGEELKAKTHASVEEANYQMYCFWSGEGHLGQANGVVATEPGFMNGHEVVRVWYDENVISKKELDSYAVKASCQPVAGTGKFRPDRDPQYYLKHSPYRYLPLTPLQRSRINSALGHRESADEFLSPTQLKWLQAVRKDDKGMDLLYTEDFVTAWESVGL